MPDILHKSDLFNGLDGQEIESLLNDGRRIILQPKKILFSEGDPAKNCFLVNRGRLKLTKLNEQGKEVILRFIGSGELTAAISILKDWAYPVTAESVEETEVVGWDKPAMTQLMRRHPDIAINLLGIVLERIDDVQHRYLEVCTEHVEQRIARSLLRLMRRAGVKTPEGIHINIPLSRQNIADYAGTTLYTVSRTLSSWGKRGWIQSARERIVITDPHALIQFVETN